MPEDGVDGREGHRQVGETREEGSNPRPRRQEVQGGLEERGDNCASSHHSPIRWNPDNTGN